MTIHTESKMVNEVYLSTVFETEEKEDNLRKIEVLGIPTQGVGNAEGSIDENAYKFLEDCLAKELFKANRTLSRYSFESLKIWLYDTNKPHNSQGHSVPSLEQVTFKLSSHLDTSELKHISILDIGLSGNQEKLWKIGCEELFQPMFNRFVAPPDPPDVLKDFLMLRFGSQLTNRLDLFLSMRKNMYFDAFIIEAK